MNIGPGPDGDWDTVAYERLQQIGSWIKINGEGIYNTTSVAPYSEANTFYTKSKKADNIYAFVLSDKDKDQVTMPESLSFHLKGIKKVKKVSLLGVDKKLKWTVDGSNIKVLIPKDIPEKNELNYAAVFKIQY